MGWARITPLLREAAQVLVDDLQLSLHSHDHPRSPAGNTKAASIAPALPVIGVCDRSRIVVCGQYFQVRQVILLSFDVCAVTPGTLKRVLNRRATNEVAIGKPEYGLLMYETGQQRKVLSS